MNQQWNELLVALADVYATEARPEADATAACCGQVAALWRCSPCAHDAGIRNALKHSPHPAASIILANQSLMPWGPNLVRSYIDDHTFDISAVATLMGPDGPLIASDLRMGLFYQQPNSYYGLHSHDADETYVIIAGEALWTAGDDIRLRGPGSYIHHPSLMPHAFKAGPLGFVALWRWSGDINVVSYKMLPDPLAVAG